MGVREEVEFEGFWRQSVKKTSTPSIAAELERGCNLCKIGQKSTKSVESLGVEERVEFEENQYKFGQLNQLHRI